MIVKELGIWEDVFLKDQKGVKWTMQNIRPNLDVIADNRIKNLAADIFNILSSACKIDCFEIVVEDIYCQVGQGDDFAFSVELRNNDAEFFLFDMNFVMSNWNDYEFFRSNLIKILQSVISGNYSIEKFYLGKFNVKSEIVFDHSLRIPLFKSILNSVVSFFPLRLTKQILAGRPISF